MFTNLFIKSLRKANQRLSAVCESNSKILEAFEKQTPKKPKIVEYRHLDHSNKDVLITRYQIPMCPVCWSHNAPEDECKLKTGSRYCSRCGQAIDWRR